ncbi:ankyrin repeat domain-containing protein [Vibrio tritonius]|uniref:ankyrin repeat domain-containing protein n=1 Tax=Vibrio tritonius TaxID=1435069 RepID=UPI00315D4753
MNALIQAVLSNDIEQVIALLDIGYDVNEQDEHKMTALLYSCAEQNEEIMKVLIEANAEVNHRNENGFSALDIATIAGEIAMATSSPKSIRMQKHLITHGARSGF